MINNKITKLNVYISSVVPESLFVSTTPDDTFPYQNPNDKSETGPLYRTYGVMNNVDKRIHFSLSVSFSTNCKLVCANKDKSIIKQINGGSLKEQYGFLRDDIDIPFLKRDYDDAFVLHLQKASWSCDDDRLADYRRRLGPRYSFYLPNKEYFDFIGKLIDYMNETGRGDEDIVSLVSYYMRNTRLIELYVYKDYYCKISNSSTFRYPLFEVTINGKITKLDVILNGKVPEYLFVSSKAGKTFPYGKNVKNTPSAPLNKNYGVMNNIDRKINFIARGTDGRDPYCQIVYSNEDEGKMGA
ncbi:unnamed protein product [Ambrosiozyma monospora]|uniref:Unnamed protein product n=1 Tax=Ambrosiozyma monospora TaxID=43982 RepID=A0ACB5SZL1_AMBMO|nr:unnamed protein product [Ambrosiozyma monospora]